MSLSSDNSKTYPYIYWLSFILVVMLCMFIQKTGTGLYDSVYMILFKDESPLNL